MITQGTLLGVRYVRQWSNYRLDGDSNPVEPLGSHLRAYKMEAD